MPHEEWTCRLLDRGFTPRGGRGDPRAGARRDRPARDPRRRRAGRSVPVEAFLDAETLARCDAWLAEGGRSVPPPDLRLAAGLWALFLACRSAGGDGPPSP